MSTSRPERQNGRVIPDTILRMKECFHLERTVEDLVVQDYTKPIRVKHLSSEVRLSECTSLVKTGIICCRFGVCSTDVFS